MMLYICGDVRKTEVTDKRTKNQMAENKNIPEILVFEKNKV